ncbi:hypothetical protein C5B96_04790 [Subtercola sp. Z020]|uniref:hypothetical protein n=1 Tax=Subtercola sp. Z020 TaxID=2080582 RepID=UPI000CE7CA67|nr:hypothetical protein [Subtercola sp. Z020]PPF86703.1 hypothetical protein C5B96_04790 [Subtercola sp. Z020]
MSANAEPEEPRRKTTAEQREARARETLQKISAGGDLGLEALTLSNDFTDEYTGRFRAWLRRRLGRSTS